MQEDTHPSIAVAMIVRDNQDTISRAIDSVIDAIDELVVVDTGSTDRTLEVVQRYTKKIYHFDWIDDFAAARQYAFDHCTAEWIIWFDSDDEVLCADEIRASIEAVPENVDALLWPYILARGPDGGVAQQAWRERCVRRGKYRWQGRVHEALVPVGAHLFVADESVQIEHHGGNDPYAHVWRNIRILRASIAEQDPPRPRDLFYLGRDLLVAGEPLEALPHLHAYLASADEPEPAWLLEPGMVAVTPLLDQRYYALLLVAYCYRSVGNYDAAINMDFEALRLNPRWPHAYFGLAADYLGLERWRWVLHWADLGRMVPDTADATFPLSPGSLPHVWQTHYAMALANLGRLEPALALAAVALSQRPDDPGLQDNVRRLQDAVDRARACATPSE